MLRFFYVLVLLPKYCFLYLLKSFKVSSGPKPRLLKNFFEEAGGAFIKFGQLLALRVDVLPKGYTLELIDLFDHIKAFSYKEVEIIFLKELGTTPDKIFPYFEREPFASGSFGQVYAAKLKDDQRVIVKIQRPGIERKVKADFLIIDILSIIADIFFKIEAMPWREFAREFKNWTRNELDYQIEAENAQRIYDNVANVPDTKIVIPQTHHRLSTKRILVQDYIDGTPLTRLLKELRRKKLTPEQLKSMGVDIKKAPWLIVSELMRQYFFDGFFHADPHPGNILFLEDGKIGIIDFGIAGKAAPKKLAFMNFVKSGAEREFQKAGYYFLDFAGGELKQIIGSAIPASFDQKYVEELMNLLANHFFDYWKEIDSTARVELKTMKTDYAAMLLKMLKFAQRYHIKLPKEMIVFVRALGVIGFLAKEMDYNFHLEDMVLGFFKKYPEATTPMEEVGVFPYKRMNREIAMERLNNWLTYLLETDTKLYQLVEGYLSENKVVSEIS